MSSFDNTQDMIYAKKSNKYFGIVCYSNYNINVSYTS